MRKTKTTARFGGRWARSAAAWPVLFLLLAGPSAAYVVVLKDGKQITTAKKYERKGREVILTMPNGVTTSYLASDIDFEKTEELNAGGGLSNARVLDTGNAREVETRSGPEEPEDLTFTDLLENRKKLALPGSQKRQPEVDSEGETIEVQADLPTTPAGFVDLMSIRREPLENDQMVSEIVGYLTGQGNSVKVYQGTREGWPLVELSAASEASVFKVMKDASSCLVQVKQQIAGLQGFELLILTDSGIRGGQFSLTEARANELLTGRVEPQTFFLRYVEF